MLSPPGLTQETCFENNRNCSPVVSLAVPQEAKKEAVDESIDLLAGEFSKTWQVFSSDPSLDASTIWKIMPEPQGQEVQLECSGEPKGFVFTNAEFTNFELSLEWRYPADANGNSGILVYMQNEPRIWPTSVQIQLHQPKAGSIFPSGDAMTSNTVENPPDLVRPVNMWNLCRVVSQDGNVSVEINGKKAGEVTGAKPASGRIALQSEGSIVQFRRIRIRNLSPPAKVPGTNSSPGNSSAGSAGANQPTISPGQSK
jgi:hypothetical protein